MKKVVVIYHSYKGVTGSLVESLIEGIREGGGEKNCRPAGEATIDDLLDADTIVLACGQPFGTLDGHIKTFLEKCWIAPERQRLQGKPFSYVLNGNVEPKKTGAYLEKLAGYFQWPLAAPGLLITAEQADQALPQARALGKLLAG